MTTTHEPATDLGYLLHKHPDKHQVFSLPFGTAHVFYAEATLKRCTAALVLDVDPIALVRGGRFASGGGLLDQYVNDRPYAAASFLSVAIRRVFGSALGGRTESRADLAEMPISLEARLTPLRCRGGLDLARALFEPLGYTLAATRVGESAYWDVTISATTQVSGLLTHLYVLIPVLDDQKHYWVAEDEIEKLLRHGEGWLQSYPLRDLITIIGGTVTDMVHNHQNYAWRETHDGRDLWVVRKGATPAFPGQRGFVGGSMGDDALIIEGVDGPQALASLYSTVHGAGRMFGRKRAKQLFAREQMDAWLRERGVLLAGGDLDESPMAYRRLPDVLAQHAGTIRVLHILRPFAVAMAGEGEFDPFKD